jgi:multimeric flavodoxin WrbA
MRTRHFLFLVASARVPGVIGNTETLARRAALHLPAGARATWLHLNDLAIAPFDDRRHDVGSYPMPEADTRRLLEATLAATDIVFVTPLYWYSLPHRLKLYLDHWSAWMRIPDLDFKGRMQGKRAWAVTTSGSREKTQPMFDSLALCADFLAMHWQGALWGRGGAPGAIEADDAALASATTFFGASVTPA